MKLTFNLWANEIVESKVFLNVVFLIEASMIPFIIWVENLLLSDKLDFGKEKLGLHLIILIMIEWLNTGKNL